MPQPITTAYTGEHADLFRDARIITANEFRALDGHDQYYNAFSRLLKRDPLNRVAMLGTDQRDQFVPKIKALLGFAGKRPTRILDVGCGDGQTFALVSSAVAEGSTIDLIDPNQEYVDAFAKRVAAMPNVALGAAHARAYVPDPEDAIYQPPLQAAYDLIFSIHSLYFFEDFAACIAEIHARLAPGGQAIIVFADESVSYTGVCFRAWLRHIGQSEAAEEHRALCDERLAWLSGPSPRAALGARVEIFPQQTRLFGNSIADIIALSNIAGLSLHDDLAKFEIVADVLEKDPESVSFRIEDQPGPRMGMLSVLQPQIVCAITKPE
jgi:SAM-dependent methyltransferase